MSSLTLMYLCNLNSMLLRKSGCFANQQAAIVG